VKSKAAFKDSLCFQGNRLVWLAMEGSWMAPDTF
jgi:hypothetical protein